MSQNRPLEKILLATALPYYQEIRQSDFVQQILAGSLPKERFCSYLAQDALYLAQEAELLRDLAQKAPSEQKREFFVAMSQDCIAIEQEMQATFFQEFSIHSNARAHGQFAQYLRFLQACLTQGFSIAIFAYFPCYYLYARLGKELCAQEKTPNNKYQSYLDTYAGEPYKFFVDKYLLILEKQFAKSTQAKQDAMLKIFAQACRFESSIFRAS